MDVLEGLKENVIIGKLIPAATGLKRYRRIEIEPSEPLPRADDVGLLDCDELAAELGLIDGDFGVGLGAGFEQDLVVLEEIGSAGGDTGLRRGARRARRPDGRGRAAGARRRARATPARAPPVAVNVGRRDVRPAAAEAPAPSARSRSTCSAVRPTRARSHEQRRRARAPPPTPRRRRRGRRRSRRAAAPARRRRRSRRASSARASRPGFGRRSDGAADRAGRAAPADARWPAPPSRCTRPARRNRASASR